MNTILKVALSAALAGVATMASAAMPVGNAANGAKIFVQCKTCHVTTPGVNRIGPTLHAVVGRHSGSVPNYTYSAANKKSGVTWTEANLFTYLEAPRKFIPGTKMTYAGLKDPQQRADVIAYLKTQ
jgi:cytochrome c